MLRVLITTLIFSQLSFSQNRSEFDTKTVSTYECSVRKVANLESVNNSYKICGTYNRRPKIQNKPDFEANMDLCLSKMEASLATNQKDLLTENELLEKKKEVCHILLRTHLKQPKVKFEGGKNILQSLDKFYLLIGYGSRNIQYSTNESASHVRAENAGLDQYAHRNDKNEIESYKLVLEPTFNVCGLEDMIRAEFGLKDHLKRD